MGIAVERKLKHSRRLAWAFRGKYEVEVIRSAELGKGTGLPTKLVQSWEHNVLQDGRSANRPRAVLRQDVRSRQA